MKLCLAGLLLALAVGCNNAPAAQVASLTMSGAAAGQKGRLRVNLANPANGNQKVDLTWTGTALNGPPTSITIPSGSLSAEVAYSAGSALGTANVAAKLGSTTVASSGVVVQSFAVASITSGYYDDELELGVGQSAGFVVTLNAVPPADTVVDIAVAPAGVASFPTTVMVPALSASGNFIGSGVAMGGVSVSAKVGSASFSTGLYVYQNQDSLYTYSSTAVGGLVEIEPELGVPANTDTVVQVTSSNPAVINPPATITVPAGQSYAYIYSPALSSGYALITATIHGKSFPKPLRVGGSGYFQYSYSLSGSAMEVGTIGYVYVESPSGGVPADTTFNATPSTVGVFDVGGSVDFPAHTSEAVIPVTAKTPGSTTFSLAVPGEGGSVVGPFTVVDHATLTSVSAYQTPVKGTGNFFYVTLNASVAKDTTVTLTQTGTGHYSFTGNPVVGIGSTTAYFNMTPDTSGPVTVTATLGATSVTYTFTIP